MAGEGQLPAALAAAARGRGDDVRLYAIDGLYNGDLPPDRVLGLGEVGRLRRHLSEDGATHIAMSGRFYRPDYGKIAWDAGAVALLPKILKTGVGGDDSASRAIIAIASDWDVTLLAPSEIAPDYVAAAGTLSRKRPTKAQRADIAFGLAVVARLAPHDVGQAVVVHDKRVLAVEAAEGTDAMIARIAELRRAGRFTAKTPTGLMIKTAKPGQDMRLDMPVVGVETVQAAREAGLAGLAVGAGRVLLPRREDVLAAADAAGLLFVSVDASTEPDR